MGCVGIDYECYESAGKSKHPENSMKDAKPGTWWTLKIPDLNRYSFLEGWWWEGGRSSLFQT